MRLLRALLSKRMRRDPGRAWRSSLSYYWQRLAIVVLCVGAVRSANAQQQQPFTLRVDAQLVVETVTVKDRDGKSIEGLTARDFTITEDGVRQDIGVFEF